MSKSAEWDEAVNQRNRLTCIANDLNQLQLDLLRISWLIEDAKPVEDILLELRNARDEAKNLSYLALRGLRDQP